MESQKMLRGPLLIASFMLVAGGVACGGGNGSSDDVGDVEPGEGGDEIADFAEGDVAEGDVEEEDGIVDIEDVGGAEAPLVDNDGDTYFSDVDCDD
ncbi:MAG: hypothetical protein ABIJ56_21350, partial [Pseudomonadota bacterium]